MKAFTTFILIGCFLFCGSYFCGESTSLAGENPETDDSYFELKSTIMELDLAHDLMIIAEKEIHLRSFIKDGKKKWKTSFVNTDGTRISIKLFKQYDNVFVLGEKNNLGEIEADEIMMLPSNQKILKKKKAVKLPETAKKPITPVHLEGGVWVN